MQNNSPERNFEELPQKLEDALSKLGATISAELQPALDSLGKESEGLPADLLTALRQNLGDVALALVAAQNMLDNITELPAVELPSPETDIQTRRDALMAVLIDFALKSPGVDTRELFGFMAGAKLLTTAIELFGGLDNIRPALVKALGERDIDAIWEPEDQEDGRHLVLQMRPKQPTQVHSETQELLEPETEPIIEDYDELLAKFELIAYKIILEENKTDDPLTREAFSTELGDHIGLDDVANIIDTMIERDLVVLYEAANTQYITLPGLEPSIKPSSIEGEPKPNMADPGFSPDEITVAKHILDQMMSLISPDARLVQSDLVKALVKGKVASSGAEARTIIKRLALRNIVEIGTSEKRQNGIYRYVKWLTIADRHLWRDQALKIQKGLGQEFIPQDNDTE